MADLTTRAQLVETNGIVILPRDAVRWTGIDDPIRYYYRPLTAPLYRARLGLVARLLGPGPFDAVLDAGYGSGVLFPELSRRAKHLAGIDVHEEPHLVAETLVPFGVEADLRRGSLLDMPFEDATFDGLVCVSVLEHLEELDRALDEFRRVLRPGGTAVLGFPVRNPVTDVFFRAMGYDPRHIHPSGHGDILAAAHRHPGFVVEREARFPRFLPLPLSAYVGARLRAR